ncbi:MAG: glycosyltransferase family 4 protein [Gemmatimonadales bacterium]|nr:glycosyltransferase family 4 protein [Gemmatimonadales bacterium]
MRVVFVTHNYPRSSGDLPGAFLHPLAVALRARGHDVRVVAPADRGQGGRDSLDGVPVFRVRYGAAERETLAYSGKMQDAVRSPGGLLAIRSLVDSLRRGAREELRGATDAVIHAHWWFPAGLAAPAGVPAVITLHGTDARLLERNVLARWLGGRVLRRADVVTTVSTSLAESIMRNTGVTAQVQPMPAVVTPRGWSSGGGGIVMVARLTAQKRIGLGIQAAARMPRPMPVTIVGDGPERSSLESLAAELGVPVHFTGALPPDRIPELLAAADVMLFPAVGEGLGLAAIEALMAGVPVVVCRDGGGVVSAVQIHGGGFVADPEPDALSGAVAEGLTPEARAAAQRAGAHWREDLEPGRVAERFERWYRKALGQ